MQVALYFLASLFSGSGGVTGAGVILKEGSVEREAGRREEHDKLLSTEC